MIEKKFLNSDLVPGSVSGSGAIQMVVSFGNRGRRYGFGSGERKKLTGEEPGSDLYIVGVTSILGGSPGILYPTCSAYQLAILIVSWFVGVAAFRWAKESVILARKC